MTERKKAKKVILIVSFGTSYREAEESCITPVENRVASVFGDYDVRRAFTSGIIIRKLGGEGRVIQMPIDAVRTIADEGFTHVIVQPLLFMKGHEFNNKIVNPLTALQNSFAGFVIGDPLMCSRDDFQQMEDIIAVRKASVGNEPVLLMGHGTDHPSNRVYQKLQIRLDKENRDIFIATVEGSPGLDDVVPILLKRGIKRIHLFPLMLVAGDHARNDMAGDNEDSWRSVLERLGIEAIPHVRGMGESVLLQKLVIQHIRTCQGMLFPG